MHLIFFELFCARKEISGRLDHTTQESFADAWLVRITTREGLRFKGIMLCLFLWFLFKFRSKSGYVLCLDHRIFRVFVLENFQIFAQNRSFLKNLGIIVHFCWVVFFVCQKRHALYAFSSVQHLNLLVQYQSFDVEVDETSMLA